MICDNEHHLKIIVIAFFTYLNERDAAEPIKTSETITKKLQSNSIKAPKFKTPIK